MLVATTLSPHTAALLLSLVVWHAGLEPNRSISYWLSLDAKGIVKYGKGYHMEETTLLQCCVQGAESPHAFAVSGLSHGFGRMAAVASAGHSELNVLVVCTDSISLIEILLLVSL